jgi:hypothetical protein
MWYILYLHSGPTPLGREEPPFPAAQVVEHVAMPQRMSKFRECLMLAALRSLVQTGYRATLDNCLIRSNYSSLFIISWFS